MHRRPPSFADGYLMEPQRTLTWSRWKPTVVLSALVLSGCDTGTWSPSTSHQCRYAPTHQWVETQGGGQLITLPLTSLPDSIRSGLEPRRVAGDVRVGYDSAAWLALLQSQPSATQIDTVYIWDESAVCDRVAELRIVMRQREQDAATYAVDVLRYPTPSPVPAGL